MTHNLERMECIAMFSKWRITLMIRLMQWYVKSYGATPADLYSLVDLHTNQAGTVATYRSLSSKVSLMNRAVDITGDQDKLDEMFIERLTEEADE